MNQLTKTPIAKRSRTIKKRPWLRTAQPRTIGIKISELPELTDLAATDEVTTLAEGVNYRSPLSALGGEFNTVAAMLASTASAQGVGAVWRADGFRYREADPAATDHHLTTAGGVKLYVQPSDDGWYNFLAMNPARDGVTNDAELLKKLLLIRPLGPVGPTQVHWVPGPSIHFPVGIYYMDAGPWGFQLKAITHLRGESQAPGARRTYFKFPADVVGIMVNHYDTFENQVEDDPWTGGALGSTIERIGMRSNGGLGSNPNAHGIWAKSTVHVRDCEINGFYGHGICVTGGGGNGPYWVSGTNYTLPQTIKSSGKVLYVLTVDPGATPSTVEPSHQYGEVIGADGYGWTTYNHGGPSASSFTNVTCHTNHNCGIFIQGHDASVMVGVRVDTYANGRWGIYDDCFLGNTWVGAHSEGNGLATRGGNPPGNSSCVRMQHNGTRDVYFAVHTATEQQLVDTEPGTPEAEGIWQVFRDDLVSVGDDVQHVPWLPGQPVGTYFVGGCFWSANSAQRNLWLGCYAELSEAFGALGPVSMAIGGIANWQGGAAYEAISNIMTTKGGYGVIDRYDNRITIAADPNSSASLFRAFSYRSTEEASTWIWQYSATTGDYALQYAGSSDAYYLTTINTTNKMGTSKTQPYRMHFPTLAIGPAASTRRMTYAGAKPATGEYAVGDIVWNAYHAINSFAGWVCITAGTFTSTAWTTGTNYVLNAYVLATGGKYYRCSVDPGAGLSTVEPSHASGEVIEADGYGWTFVSSEPPEFVPFGATIDLYEHTTNTVLALSVDTHPRLIVHNSATPIAVSLNVTLPVTAFRGANFRITRKTSGAGVLNVGTGPLKAMAADTWCEVAYTGTAWILTASGTL